PKAPKRPGRDAGDAPLFKMSDMSAIARQAPSIRSVVPGIDVPCTFKHLGRTKHGHIWGGYEDYVTSSNRDKLAHGRFFTKAERMGAARVAIIGDKIAKDLFEDWESPVGSEVKVNGVSYHIIGQFERRAMAF